MNEHLARWVLISVIQYIETVASGLSLPVFVEGVDERTDDNQRVDRVELRLHGPNVSERSNNYWKIDVRINLGFIKHMDLASADAYDIVTWAGTFADALLDPIPIYKRGTGVDDDDSLVGCLTVRNREPEAVMTWHFGQKSKDDRLRESEVDALYDMVITS